VLCLVVWYDLLCRVVCFLELLCDDDISPYKNHRCFGRFHAVDVVELWMINDYLLTTDYIDISTKVIISSGRCSLLSYTVTSKP